MDPATEPNDNNKRVRFTRNQASLPTSAVEKAKFIAMLPFASLPSTIKTLASGYFSKFLELRIHLRSLYATQCRLSQDAFIPHSARVKFELNASKRVKEKAGALYEALALQAEIALAIFKEKAKAQIVDLIELEIKVCKDDIAVIFCRAVDTLACALAIHHPTLDRANAADLVYLVFEKHHDELLDFSEIPSVQAFFDIFKTTADLPTEAHQHETLSLERQQHVEDARDSLKTALAAIFTRSWTAYLGIKAEQERQLALQEFVETSFKKSATASVAMDVDQITLDSPALQEFITLEISKTTKGLQAQVSNLQNKLQAKNKTPGANKPRARPTNKKGTKNPVALSKKATAPAAAPPAAAAAKGSTVDNRKPGKKKQKPRRNGSKKNKPS
jgi:hypothetical protein